VLSAIVFLIISLAIGIGGSSIAGHDDGFWWIPILFAYLLVPISFMVAILRYRLYEIDRLVSRTVTYSVIVTVLVGVYAVAVGAMTQVLPLPNDVAVATATLAAAAAFSPLRRRVQRRVDRRFNRTRFDADQELGPFVHRIRDRTHLLDVERDLAAVVNRTLQPAAVTLWFRR
jgi:O-antigen/teichoic acid export membrane protein